MKACIFHDTSPGQQDRKIFEIVEDAYTLQVPALIYAQNDERAAAIDRFLWILKQDSFVPHRIFNSEEPDSSVRIAIVTMEINPVNAHILIADGHCGLEFARRFEIVHEFVNRASPEIHEACRERFRSYRSENIPVQHLKE